MIDLPEQIAYQREKKDVGGDSYEIVGMYRNILDTLITYCKEMASQLG